jgi:hypothetical protein
MIDSRFDEAVKAVARGTSRRRAVKTLLGVGAATITAAGVRGGEVEAAKCVECGQACNPGKECPAGCRCKFQADSDGAHGICRRTLQTRLACQSRR